LARFEFKSGIVLFYFSFTFVSFGESCLLVLWCAGGRCDMACSGEDRGRSRTIERSHDVVCDLHRARGDEEREFLS
jgi:hypothetical protein